jgi:hypothetical protein
MYSCIVTAKIFKLPFFLTPKIYSSLGAKMKALVLEVDGTVVTSLFYLVKVKNI